MENPGIDLPAQAPAVEVCSEPPLEAKLGEITATTERAFDGSPPRGEEPLLLPPAQCWAALHTHSRSEKVVAKRLEHLGVPHYLPLALVKRTYGTRVRTSHVPLFPGYLFFDKDAVHKHAILDSKRVVRFIPCPDPEQLRIELTSVARLLQVKPDLQATDFGPPGSPVDVIAGPFEGMRGEVVRYAGKARLVIRIPYLALATEVSIDEALLNPVPAEESSP